MGPGRPGLQAARAGPLPSGPEWAAQGLTEAPQKTGQPCTQRANECALQSCRRKGPGTEQPEEAPAEAPTDSAALEETAGEKWADRWEGPPLRSHGTGDGEWLEGPPAGRGTQAEGLCPFRDYCSQLWGPIKT